MNKESNGFSQEDISDISDDAKSGQKNWKIRIILFFLITALLAGGAYYLYLQMLDTELLSETSETSVLEELMQDNRNLADRLSKQEKQLETVLETQEILTKALKELQGSSGRNRSRWTLIETERLLVVANHRLHLAKDIDAAINALRTADHQLRTLSDPRLLEVRKLIAKEIKALDSLERLDVVGLTSRLSAISDDAKNLPLSVNTQKFEKTPGKNLATENPAAGDNADTGTDSDSDSFLGEIWRDLKGLVNTRDDIKQDQRLLSPEQSFFVRENFKLKISATQHALLAGNMVLFKDQITQTLDLIETYFDVNKSEVLVVKKQLLEMQSHKTGQKWPEINGSLELLRKVTSDLS